MGCCCTFVGLLFLKAVLVFSRDGDILFRLLFRTVWPAEHQSKPVLDPFSHLHDFLLFFVPFFIALSFLVFSVHLSGVTTNRG
jgi:hypothetical protein